jgi:hypothetical protein
LHLQEVIIMSRTRRIAIILTTITLTAGIQIAASPVSGAATAGRVQPMTQGPIRCC